MHMDWTTIIISCIPSIITATISYFTACHKGKNDLKRAAQENNATIDRLVKQHEINVEALREQHKMEMEAKDKEHEQKLQLMQKEYELRMSENNTTKTADFTNPLIASFIQSCISDPDSAQKRIASLHKLSTQCRKLK